MDIPLDAEVVCTDGAAGRSTFVIVNPETQALTHIVVREQRRPHLERVVSVDAVAATSSDHILLRTSREELAAADPFIEKHYVRSRVALPRYVAASGAILEVPVGYRHVVREVRSRSIPEGELAVRRGQRVLAADGAVGTVDEFLIDAAGHITHLVLRKGHLWGQRDVAIPVGEIDRQVEGMIHVRLRKAEIEKLPAAAVAAAR